MQPTVINFPAMHPTQAAVAGDPARFRVLAAGRRWGKSRLGSALCVAAGLRGQRAWWVAPTYKLAAVGWRMIQRLSGPIPGAEPRLVDRQITYPGGGEVTVRSADDPNSLRGEGLDLVVMDECAFMLEAAWNEALRPALSDRKGRAIFISTPKRRNWFHRLYLAGRDGGEYRSWQLPTADNPYIDAAEIVAAREQLPEDVFRQEYLAEFLEGEGAVFRNLAACMGAPLDASPDAHAGHDLVVGVDWGKQLDYTAMSVGCATCRVEVARDRSNRIDYAVQRGRLATLAERWHASVIVAESNAMGEPVIEQLQRDGLPVRPFMTTAVSKPPLIESLVLAFERGEWAWQADPIWTGELEAYERRVNQVTGRSTYSAPDGLHDDTVIARALMLSAASGGPLVLFGA